MRARGLVEISILVFLHGNSCSRAAAYCTSCKVRRYSRSYVSRIPSIIGGSSQCSSSLQCNSLYARRFSQPYHLDDDNNNAHDELSRQQQLSTDRPTQTRTYAPDPPVIPSKPKIIVLGASGKIGRLVVRQLLEMPHLDATIVAFCRDYDKACRVLYDDLIVARSQKRGPRLQIIQGDLIQPEDIPGYHCDDDDEESEWRTRAASTAKFYGTKLNEYDNSNESEQISDEALDGAIRGCTAIISCVGSVRPTNIWTDFLERPVWRLLNLDVRSWCRDSRHPFYVHYLSTKKILRLAEKEQIRREATIALDENTKPTDNIPRIRFIRISDLVCSQEPWNIVPLVTNIIQSMVFRYQEMAEKSMEESTLIDSVTLRPGDLIDDIRDESTTSLQVCPSGAINGPSRVGREDVAALAVAAALFDFKTEQSTNISQATAKQNLKEKDQPFHFTLACRWAGEEMEPYPAQGKKSDGHPSAIIGLKAAFPVLQRQTSRRRIRHLQREKMPQEPAQELAQTPKTGIRKIKPYGICVAIPVYIMISIMTRTLCHHAATYIPGVQPLMPLIARIPEVIVGTIGLISGKLNQLQWGLVSLLSLLSGRSAPKYIPF